MAKHRYRATTTFVGDFETTVYDGQTSTEVWASALIELYKDNPILFHSIDDTYTYITLLKKNIVIYYHNLKFDGSFWLDYLILRKGFKLSASFKDNSVVEFNRNRDMQNGEIKYLISDMGIWYNIVIKVNGYIIEFRDSLKLLPFSLHAIGKSFNTQHQKLDMEYKGKRFAGCIITEEEKQYIFNDVYVIKEALEIMFNQGHDKMTIGSCCMDEFKECMRLDFRLQTVKDFSKKFPNLTEYELDNNLYGYDNAEQYVRASYKGGWTYVVKGKERRIHTNGCTLDVNSLYPSVMHSHSGNYYPIGEPHFWKGNFIPDEALQSTFTCPHYYFVRFRCRFKIKEGYLPFIMIKGNHHYPARVALTTSNVYDRVTKQWYEYYKDKNGEIKRAVVELVLTMTDWELFNKHYEIYDLEILDGCWFYSDIGLFDCYIDKWAEVKQKSKGAMRTLAKLFLNNLYGKFATSPVASFKVCDKGEEGNLLWYTVYKQELEKVVYIPIGTAITSYARCFTITAAQLNYHGVENRGFIYADTDSIHCDLPLEQIKGVNIHPTEFLCWKCETNWDKAWFLRAKSYIEHITHEDGEKIDTPYYNIKCAGMGERNKKILSLSLEGDTVTENNGAYYNEKGEKFTEEEAQFINQHRNITDFDYGLKIPSKLMAKRITGGTVLIETEYELRRGVI